MTAENPTTTRLRRDRVRETRFMYVVAILVAVIGAWAGARALSRATTAATVAKHLAHTVCVVQLDEYSSTGERSLARSRLDHGAKRALDLQGYHANLGYEIRVRAAGC